MRRSFYVIGVLLLSVIFLLSCGMGDWFGGGGGDEWGGGGSTPTTGVRFKFYNLERSPSRVDVNYYTFNYTPGVGLEREEVGREFSMSFDNPDNIVKYKADYLKVNGEGYVLFVLKDASGDICVTAVERGGSLPAEPCTNDNKLNVPNSSYAPYRLMTVSNGEGKVLVLLVLSDPWGAGYGKLLEYDVDGGSVRVLLEGDQLDGYAYSLISSPFIGITRLKNVSPRIMRYASGTLEGVDLEDGNGYSDYIVLAGEGSKVMLEEAEILEDGSLMQRLYECNYDGSRVTGCRQVVETYAAAGGVVSREPWLMSKGWKVGEGYYLFDNIHRPSEAIDSFRHPLLFYSEVDGYFEVFSPELNELPSESAYVEVL